MKPKSQSYVLLWWRTPLPRIVLQWPFCFLFTSISCSCHFVKMKRFLIRVINSRITKSLQNWFNPDIKLLLDMHCGHTLLLAFWQILAIKGMPYLGQQFFDCISAKIKEYASNLSIDTVRNRIPSRSSDTHGVSQHTSL